MSRPASLTARALILVSTGLFLSASTGCNLVPAPMLAQSRMQVTHLHHQNQFYGQENSELKQQLAAANQQLSTTQQRLANMKDGYLQLKQQNLGLIGKLRGGRSPLGGRLTQRLKDLAGKYKNFEFDPETGVSKFHSDILFDIGSAQVKPGGLRLLKEFASIMNDDAARGLNVLVVGHTDDRRIARSSTRHDHPTNWHLSTNRANSVVLLLSKFGIGQRRLGAAGYSMFHPAAPNSDETNRSQNRRVEIYVLTPDAAVAGRRGYDDIHRN